MPRPVMMRQHRRVPCLAALAVALLGLGLLPPSATQAGTSAASPLLIVDPGAAAPGVAVTLVGTGFTAATTSSATATNSPEPSATATVSGHAASECINASTDSSAPVVIITFVDAAGQRVTLPETTTTTSAGTFSISVVVPRSAAPGPGAFSATDSNGATATASFDVRPARTTIDIAPNYGAPGASTALTGAGFAAGQPLTVTFSQGTGRVVSTVLAAGAFTATATGLFTGTIVIPGDAPAGGASIAVQDRDGNSVVAPFAVIRAGSPTLLVAPSSPLRPSTPITVTGVNFAAGEPVTVTYSQALTSTTSAAAAIVSLLISGTITTDAMGAFTTTAIAPATAVAGTATISATDQAGNSASLPVTITVPRPTLGITPTTLVASTPVTITGAGFSVARPITLTFGQRGSTRALNAGAVATDAAGLFTATATIPSTAITGAATISATDGVSISASLSIMIEAARPVLVVTPTEVIPTAPMTLTGSGFVPAQAITLTFSQRASTIALKSTTLTADSDGAFTATAPIPASALTGTAIISATDAAGNVAGVKIRVALPVRPDNGPTTLYFAEGFTGGLRPGGEATFDETLAILNGNPFTATVAIHYFIQDGAPLTVTRTLAPYRMLRESVNKDVGGDRIVAAVVSSRARITAERSISRVSPTGAPLGASTSMGNPNLGATFYFPAGAVGPTYMEYLALVNPGDHDAHVTITYATPPATPTETPPTDTPSDTPSADTAPSDTPSTDIAPTDTPSTDAPPTDTPATDTTPTDTPTTGPLTATIVIPAHGRATHRVGDDDGDTFAQGTSIDLRVGMIVTSDQPIMAERVLYFGPGDGSAKFGSTTQAGIMTAGNQRIFAYGSAGGEGPAQRLDDRSAITVLNPGVSSMEAKVVAQFTDSLGRTLGVTSVVVGPGTRQTIDANAIVSDTSRVYSTLLTSSSPFVAEKEQYLGGSAEVGPNPGFALEGAVAGATSVSFPDLSLVNGFGARLQQTVFLHNPTAAPITVTGAYYSEHGSLSVDYTVEPGGITTVDVDVDAAALHARTLGGAFVVSSDGPEDSFVATNVANSTDGRSYTGTQGSLPAL